MATTLTRAPIPARDIPIRRPDFEYEKDDELGRKFMTDPVSGHIMAALSATFPHGEAFFVRSVRNVRDRITDPELKKQVNAFIGQEAIHGREHEAFNERLAEMGYPTRQIDRLIEILLGAAARFLPKKRQLAITAALEHFTATFAETLLTSQEVRDTFASDEALRLFLWHAIEESEHKAVAFDVYEHVGGSHRLRAFTMNTIIVEFLGGGFIAVMLSVLRDKQTRRNPRAVLASFKLIGQSPFVSKEMWRALRAYNKKGFHPDDRDTTELIEQWRAKLFADEATAGPSGIS